MGGGAQTEELLCEICNQLPKIVMESNCCKTVFCKNCVLSMTDGDCPTCGKATRGFQSNVPLQRLVDQEEVKCRFQPLGCTQVLEFREKHRHEQDCGFSLVDCPFECGGSMLSKDLEIHKDEKCPLRQVVCNNCGCGKSMPLALLDLHAKGECDYFKLKCNQCFKEVTKKALKEHVDNECPESLVSCPYSECGCFNKILRNQLPGHLESKTKLHLQLVLKVIGKQQQEIVSLKEELASFKGTKRLSLAESFEALQQWCTPPRKEKDPFNLMWIWVFSFAMMLWVSTNPRLWQNFPLVVVSYAFFTVYYYLVNRMDSLNWFAKGTAGVYFMVAWYSLLVICL